MNEGAPSGGAMNGEAMNGEAMNGEAMNGEATDGAAMNDGETKAQATTAKARRRVRRRRSDRGVALILVLGAITVLTVMLTEFQDDTSAELAAALADRDALKAEYLAKSGVELSRLLLASEKTISGAIGAIPGIGLMLGGIQIPVWDYADGVLGAFNDKAGNEAFQQLTGTDLSRGKNLGVEGGGFHVQIIDEDSKINVNLGAQSNVKSQLRIASQLLGLTAGEQYRPMFEQRDRDNQFSDRATICGAIIDWADPDENLNACDVRTTTPVASGTEDSFYQMLDKPYWRKNAAYDSLDELHLVRGISDDFWATFVDPSPTNPRKRVVTVWGQTKLNVNFANPIVWLSLTCAAAVDGTKICNDPEQMGKFLFGLNMIQSIFPFPLFANGKMFVEAMKGKGTLAGFVNLESIFKGMGIQEGASFKSDADLTDSISTKSEVFSIYSEGVVSGYQRRTQVRIHAVVDRRGIIQPTFLQVPQQGQQAQGGTTPAVATTGAASLTSTPAGANSAGLTNINDRQDPSGIITYYRQE